MKLQCKTEHMRGKIVTVNGTNYPIGDDLMLSDVSKEDAAKLLLNRKMWGSVLGGKKPAKDEKKLEAPPPPEKKGLLSRKARKGSEDA